MRHQKSKTESFIAYKKAELYDQLLSSIEEENWRSEDSSRSRDWPLWLTITDYAEDTREQPRPISLQEKINLTRSFKRNEIPRLIDPESCLDWAIESKENWMRIIPEGKELLLNCARENNDTQFLETVGRFEGPKRS